MTYREIIIVNSSPNISFLTIHIFSQCRKNPTGSGIKSYLQIFMNSSITFWRLQIIMLQSFDIYNRADFHTQAAINTFSLINFGIPESFNIRFKRNRCMRTYISTGVTPAAAFLIYYLFHSIKPVSLQIQSASPQGLPLVYQSGLPLYSCHQLLSVLPPIPSTSL